MDYHSQKVIDAFFQTFYHERIEIAKDLGYHYHKQFDTSLLTFWFSVIDFYGGIYSIGKNDKKNYYGNKKKLKLANGKTFTEFIKDFFPAPQNELGEFLYSVFRSGLVHQLSPKKGRIVWDTTNPKLLWVEFDRSNTDINANKIATINIYQLEQLTYNSYMEFRRKVESDELVAVCKKIYDHLLATPDGLEDGATITEQYDRLSPAARYYVNT